MTWRLSSEIYTFDGLHSGPTIVFAGDQPGQNSGPLYYPPNQWNTVDLKPFGVSADANFAEGAGFLVITDQDPSIDDLMVTLRPVGSDLNYGNYQMQAISVWQGDGRRDVQPWIVRLDDGCFELYWQKQIGGRPEVATDPTGFLVNMWLTKWGR